MKFLLRLFGYQRKPEKPRYEPPLMPCSSLIALSGPCYGDMTFFGTFLLNSVSLKVWMKDHAASVFSSDSMEQQARLHLPLWLEDVDYSCNNYVTKIDFPMRKVLVPYTYDFYLKGWIVVYCHECKSLHDAMIDNNQNIEKTDSSVKWLEEWLCPAGHVLHRKDQEIRHIKRRSSVPNYLNFRK
jgi:hypothetical protein